jgi:hypothetical protein
MDHYSQHGKIAGSERVLRQDHLEMQICPPMLTVMCLFRAGSIWSYEANAGSVRDGFR